MLKEFNVSERFSVIKIAEQRNHGVVPAVPAIPALSSEATAANGVLRDTRQRRLHDLRISVTDRCNFRCTYCMPKSIFDKDYAYLPQTSLLSFEETERLVTIFVAHGVEKIRLTGGEPLLRKNLEVLVARLAAIKTPSGADLDLTLTSNGSLLQKKAKLLRAAGLKRLTVSLDGLDDTVFRAMNDVDFPVSDVLEGIQAAQAAGLGPIKINMVVKKGVNDHQVLPMVRHFKGTGHILRFIEFMDVGSSNGWQMNDVVPSGDLVATINAEFPIKAIEANYSGEVAERWQFVDGSGELGFISSVTQPFCGDCSRARLSTEGKLYTCLFATQGHDLRALLRGSPRDSQRAYTDNEIAGAIGLIWNQRSDRYSEVRSLLSPADSNSHAAQRAKVEMSYIGG